MLESFQNLPQNKKILFLIVGILVIAIVGAGIYFATRPKPVAGKIVVSDTPIKLVWWKTQFDDEPYKEIIKDFESLPQNKNVKIEFVKKPSDEASYYKSFLLDYARDTGPDIFTIKNDDLPAYKEFCTPIENVRDATGATVPNTKLIADYKEKFVELAVKETLNRNQLFAVTTYIDNLQLYYNESLLSQAGIVNPPVTWADLDKQLSLLNKRETSGINFKQHAIALGTGTTFKGTADQTSKENINRFADIIPMLIFQNGGQLYDTLSKKNLFGQKIQTQSKGTPPKSSNIDIKESPAFQAISFFNSFADINSSRYSWNINANNSVDSFTQGRLAYMIHYSYMQDKIKSVNPSLKYSVARLPQLDEAAKKTYGFFYMDCASEQLLKKYNENKKNLVSERKYQVAKDFLYYLTTEKSQQKFSNKTNLPSAHKDVIAKQQFGNKNIRVFAAGALYADNYYKPDVKRTEKLWGDILYRTQYERVDLAKSIQIGIAEYNNIIAEGPKTKF